MPDNTRRANSRQPLRQIIFAVGATSVVVAAASCTPSAQVDAQLEKAARAVPVPAGLTFVRVDREQMGDGTRSVSLDYRNKSMTCSDLDGAWKAMLTKKHISTTSNTTSRQIFVKSQHYTVIILLGTLGDCSTPSVGAET